MPEEKVVNEPGCNCPVPLVPMKEWVEGGTEEECRPCALAPVSQWYHSELVERGFGAAAEALAQLIEEGDPLAVCAKMDEVKELDPALKTRLLDFDCQAQAFSDEVLDAPVDEDVDTPEEMA